MTKRGKATNLAQMEVRVELGVLEGDPQKKKFPRGEGRRIVVDEL